jgi:dethiobiotin synthetase
MKAQRLFITGTDTEVGKTTIACKLLTELNQHGYKTVGLKPIASGGIITAEGMRNEDALALQQAASVKLPYELINPICLESPIAPHIAAQQANLPLSALELFNQCIPTLQQAADHIVIEGAGGWLVPLNATETMADFVALLDCPIILVVAMRLGCINHALLTVANIHQHGLELGGWIANCIDPEMLNLEENLATLEQLIPAPLLMVNPNSA